jgi:hypothetical protein
VLVCAGSAHAERTAVMASRTELRIAVLLSM